MNLTVLASLVFATVAFQLPARLMRSPLLNGTHSVTGGENIVDDATDTIQYDGEFVYDGFNIIRIA